MRILLVNPPIELYQGEVAAVVVPLGLAYIAAVLEKAGYQVKILDCIALSWRTPQKIKKGRKILNRFSPPPQVIRQILLDFQPEIVGISNLMAPTEKEALKLARQVKEILPLTPVVIGGSNASVRFFPLIKNKNIDFVVVGEGEETMRELVVALKKRGDLKKIKGLVFKNRKGKAVFNPPRPLIQDLDSLPFPARHLLPMEEYFQGNPAGAFFKQKRFATMVYSRGCPNGCSFCTNEKIWQRKWRPRSVENVIQEIRNLKKTYQVKEIQFLDNNIAVDKKRLKKLCRAIKKEKLIWIPAGGVAALTLNKELIRLMAESGCYALQFGVEHGDLEMQRRIGKIVPLSVTKELVAESKKRGIWTHGNFIVGLPGETKTTAYKSLDYAIKADFDTVSFFTALPLPGSRVYEEVFGKREINLDDLKFYLSKAKCSTLSPGQVKKLINIFFKDFLVFKIKRELNPIQIFRRIRQIHSWEDIGLYWRIFTRFIQIKSL